MTPSRGLGRKFRLAENATKSEENVTEQEAGKRRTHIVLKPFQAAGKSLKPGESVDASNWRNTRQLVNCRYLIPIGEAQLRSSMKYDGSSSEAQES